MSGNLSKTGTHQITLTGETYDSILCGQRQVLTAQQPLTVESRPCFLVTIQAAKNNASYCYVGNQSDGCYIELPAGTTISIPINDVSKVYVRSATDNMIVNWLAMR